MGSGASIINSSSINSDRPVPTLFAYSATKAAIVNFTASLAQLLADRGIRANSVAPGPIWTPLIPSTMPAEQGETFGTATPMGRPDSRPRSRPCTGCSPLTRRAASPEGASG